MKKLALCAALAWTAFAPAAQAATCGAVIDDLTKAISGHLTMSPDMRASMMRMAQHSYDQCMIGNSKDSQATRDMIMTSIKSHLGQK
jgi:hypothetical protein